MRTLPCGRSRERPRRLAGYARSHGGCAAAQSVCGALAASAAPQREASRRGAEHAADDLLWRRSIGATRHARPRARRGASNPAQMGDTSKTGKIEEDSLGCVPEVERDDWHVSEHNAGQHVASLVGAGAARSHERGSCDADVAAAVVERLLLREDSQTGALLQQRGMEQGAEVEWGQRRWGGSALEAPGGRRASVGMGWPGAHLDGGTQQRREFGAHQLAELLPGRRACSLKEALSHTFASCCSSGWWRCAPRHGGGGRRAAPGRWSCPWL